MDIESVIDDLLTGNLGTPEAEDHHIDPDEWQPMQPLADAGKPIAYPIGNLPLVVREAVSEVEAYMQAPLGMIATSALTAASACVQGHYDVARDSRLRSPTSLFSLILAESGERKTAVDGLFMCRAPRDHKRHRSWRLFHAREIMSHYFESLKRRFNYDSHSSSSTHHTPCSSGDPSLQ
jgi:hypothetical protein